MFESAVISDVDAAAQALIAGKVVGFATETVYGLGADACNENAVSRVYAIKGRPKNHPLIVHVSNAKTASLWVGDLGRLHQRHFELLVASFWPGPLSIVVPRSLSSPGFACADQDSVGLRCPKHPQALALLSAFEKLGGTGIAAPSANRFGKVSPTTAQHVFDDLGADVDLILDGGPCSVGIESSIVGLLPGKAPLLLRPGIISQSAIEKVLGVPVELAIGQASQSQAALPQELVTQTTVPQVSGSLASHYAPDTPVEMLASEALVWRLQTLSDTGERYAVHAHSSLPLKIRQSPAFDFFDASSDADIYAQALYGNLRQMDRLGIAGRIARIIIEDVPSSQSKVSSNTTWDAIRDRLKRAAN